MNNELYVVSFEAAGEVCIHSKDGRPVFYASKDIAMEAARSVFKRAHKGCDGPIALMAAVMLDFRVHTAGSMLTKMGPGIKLWTGMSGILVRGKLAKEWHYRGIRPYPVPKVLRQKLVRKTKPKYNAMARAVHGR